MSDAPVDADWQGPPVDADDLPPSAWESDPDARWHLVEELRIGRVEGEGPDLFGRVRNLVPSEDGGVWVFDVLASELRRFDSEGRHLLSVGRRGEGPGEFTGNACAREGADGEIWVETETNWHRFDESGELLGTFRTPSPLACGVRSWIEPDRYLVGNSEYDRETRTSTTYFTLFDWNGSDFELVDTIPAPEVDPDVQTVTLTRTNASGSSTSERRIPFSHAPGWIMQEDGSFAVWSGRGDYSFHLQSMSGDTLRTFSRPYAPESVPDSLRQEAIEDLRRPGWEMEPSFASLDIPTTYPPFSSIRTAPDGSVWVLRNTANGRVREIFSPDGEFLGQLDIPESLAGISIYEIGEGSLWGVVRDDLDVQYVVRARIVRGKR